MIELINKDSEIKKYLLDLFNLQFENIVKYFYFYIKNLIEVGEFFEVYNNLVLIEKYMIRLQMDEEFNINENEINKRKNVKLFEFNNYVEYII